jgi:hypothetical protein
MDQRTLDIYLSRILSGFYLFLHKNNRYKLKYPTINVKYEASLYTQEEYTNSRFNEWIMDEDILSTLIMLNIWNPIKEKELNDSSNKIDDLKVDLFKNCLNPTKVKSIKKQIASSKKRQNYLYSVRHSFDHLTSSGYAEMLKNQYILINSLYDNNNNLVFKNMESVDFSLFNSLSSIIYNNVIPIDVFRLIARSESWRNYWSANKDYIFDKPTLEWSDEQKTLVIITKMYDNAYEHPECPSDKVIEDDDMFDGWMISQKRDSEKEKKKKTTEKMLGDKLNKAGEVFLVAGSTEEAKDIYDLNDPAARSTIIERENVILNSKTEINVTDLPDVQRDIMMEQNRLFKERKKQ